jgi:hypothetical protein
MGPRVPVVHWLVEGTRGGLAGIRTRDLQIKSPLLYRLSYEPTHADAR